MLQMFDRVLRTDGKCIVYSKTICNIMSKLNWHASKRVASSNWKINMKKNHSLLSAEEKNFESASGLSERILNDLKHLRINALFLEKKMARTFSFAKLKKGSRRNQGISSLMDDSHRKGTIFQSSVTCEALRSLFNAISTLMSFEKRARLQPLHIGPKT